LTVCVGDLFHVGHLNYFRRARDLGDFLVVGVNTDELSASYKDKPIIPLKDRIAIVSALRCVGIVFRRESFDDRAIVEKYGINIRAVGPDYGKFEFQRENRKILERIGVRFVVIPRTPNVSTTTIKRKIKDEKEVDCHDNIVSASSIVREDGTPGGLGVVARRVRGSRKEQI